MTTKQYFISMAKLRCLITLNVEEDVNLQKLYTLLVLLSVSTILGNSLTLS